MCADAPVHHANHTDDLQRIGRGLYRRASSDDGLTQERSKANRAADQRSSQPTTQPVPSRGDPLTEWHWEGNVQSAMVAHLAMTGWSVLSVANTATKERGVDIIAATNGHRILVEVKGYPSKLYVRGSRQGEVR